ncbi:hypothetical protein C8A01DRAFT_21332 [Parachaetomium inaequale]|uniref:Uncharacterized protein n=1 Tax=Parachaetomium inaequale TaxID=2588326 RepID=A0AAN6P4A6_9PEZI|nr:hypothetical protein C8A01DRAFT_21332 [Parachaetomium inaequale]
MLKLLRPRPFLAQGPSAVLRLRSPLPSRPTSSPWRPAERSISLGSRPPPIQTQRCAATQPTPTRLPPRPLTRPHIISRQQHRSYNYHPNGNQPPNRNQSPTPHTDPYTDPSHRLARLREAKPLINWRGWRALHTPSTYTIILAAVSGALIFYFANLETVPVSGRTRFNVYGAESVKKAGEMEYKRLLWELEKSGVRVLPEWDGRVRRVRGVMGRLIPFSGLGGEEW